MKWASTRKVNDVEVAADTRCYICAKTIADAWPNLSWSEAVMKCKSDDRFAQQVAGARQLLTNLPALQQKFLPQDVHEQNGTLCTLRRRLQFTPLAVFEQEHGVKGSDLPEGWVEELCDDSGVKLKGIISEAEGKDSYELLLDYYTRTNCQTNIHSGTRQLRPRQGSELLDHIVRSSHQKQGKGWKKPASAKDIKDVVSDIKAKAAARRGGEAPPQDAETPTAPLQDLAEGQTEAVTEDHVGKNALDLLAQQEDICKGRGRGRGAGGGAGRNKNSGAAPKARAKREAGPGSPRQYKFPRLTRGSASRSQTRPESVVGDGGESVSSQMSLQTTGGASTAPAATTMQRLQAQAIKYTEQLDLDIPPVLAESGYNRNHVYQAERVLRGLEALNAAACVEYIHLRAKYDLMIKCEQLMAKDQRHDSSQETELLLKDVCSNVPTLPPAFQVRLVSRCVRQMSLTKAGEIDAWMAAIRPCTAGDNTKSTWAFQWRAPKLADIPAEEIQQAKNFTKVAVNESLLKVLARGANGKAMAELLCRRLYDLLDPLLGAEQMKGDIMRLACGEVRDVCALVLLMCGTAFPDAQAILERAGRFKTSCLAVAQQLPQVPHWRSAEVRCRELAVAQASFLPEMETAKQKLATEDSEFDLEYMSRIVNRFVVWEEGLGKGALTCTCAPSANQKPESCAKFWQHLKDWADVGFGPACT